MMLPVYLKKKLYQWIEKKFLNGCSDYNTLAVRKHCRTKAQARQAFDRLHIPHADGMVFFNPLKAFGFVKKHGFPVVVKPNVSGYSRGSHFPITNYRELLKAVIAVKIWWPTTIIERYLKGKNYRVVVIKDDIMSVLRRYPPFVTGDGTRTIGELIDLENQTRKEMKLYPVMHPIEKNKALIRYLKKQGLEINTVPEAGVTVQLHNKIALAPGGVVQTLDKNSMAPENRDLFMRLLKAFDANILGIDAIFEKGIEYSFKEQDVIFLEINSRPFLKMHDYPRFGGRQDLSPYYNILDRIELSDSGIF